MKFVFFVEGDTEHAVIPDFFRRALAEADIGGIGIQAVKFKGCSELLLGTPKKAHLYLDVHSYPDVLGVVAAVDLHGPAYPPNVSSAAAKKSHLNNVLGASVVDPRFAHFPIVHELEAWLLSDPTIFPGAVQEIIRKLPAPENVNFDSPPSVVLNRAYTKALGREYKKVVDGKLLFARLSPASVKAKCPSFKAILDWLVSKAH